MNHPKDKLKRTPEQNAEIIMSDPFCRTMFDVAVDYWILYSTIDGLCNTLQARIEGLDQRIVRPDKREIAHARKYSEQCKKKADFWHETVDRRIDFLARERKKVVGQRNGSS